MHGAGVDMLGESRAPPRLRECLREVAARTDGAAASKAAALRDSINDTRLALEVAVIQALAEPLARDPASAAIR